VGRKTAEEIVEHFARQRALAEGGGEGDAVDNASLDAPDTLTAAADGAGLEPEMIETRLDDPEGDAADLQPIRSVDHTGEVRPPRRTSRKRGERSTNPHSVKREKIGKTEAEGEEIPS
jgi:hypothetical protein